ncbi:MAG: hypothetical protein QM479_13645 [Pseudomonadota bacterium]
MTHAIMLGLGIALFFLTRRLFYKNTELFICLLIPINYEFFHLLPRIGQYDNYREALLVVLILNLIEYFFLRPITMGKQINPYQSRMFSHFINAYLLMVFIGVINSLFWGQPLILALMEVKFHLTILVFFLIAYRDFDVNKFFNYLFIMMGIFGVILIVQYALYEQIKIFYFYKDTDTHVRGLEEIRGLRLVEGSEIIAICSVAAFSRYIVTKQKKFLFTAIYFFLLIVFVAKYRAYIATIPATYLAVYLFNNGMNPKVLIMFMALLILIPVITLVAINSPSFSDYQIIRAVDRDLKGLKTGDGDLHIRVLAYQYYYNETMKKPLLGRGVLNFMWEGNKTGDIIKSNALFLSDIGIFHIFVNFGFMGVVYLLLLFITVFSYALRYKFELALLAYFILGLAFAVEIDIFFYDYMIFMFGIFLGLLQCNLSRIHQQREMQKQYITSQGVR